MKFLPSVLALLLGGAATIVSGQGVPANNTDVDVVVYPGCAVDDYYSGLSSSEFTEWTREELQTLLANTHQNTLPVNAAQGEDDVVYAVIDLDRGNEVGKVRLAYRDIEMNNFPNQDPNYWSVERLWHPSKGTDQPSQAFTDVHHLKPADSTVLLRKYPKERNGNNITNFGMCDTVEFADFCISPATGETAPSTARDGKIWQAPERSRGEIARALMYMDLRYKDLELRDCGPFQNAIGYLSQMLEWHNDYPPDAAEERRNNQACARWQGNRNPFIDYPDLAEALYGAPQEIISGQRTYPSCLDIPTPAPTATPNECAGLGEANVPFFLVNTDDPDQVIFKPMIDIPEGIELFLTDQAWDGTDLIEDFDNNNEGTVVLVVPEGGIEQGDNFGYGPNVRLGEMWTTENGVFRLGDDGDNMFLYCIDADFNKKFLSGFTNDGAWELPDMTAEEYGTTSSALPVSLLNANIAVVHRDNVYFNGTVEGVPIDDMKRNIRDPNMWDGDDSARFSELGASSGTRAWTLFAQVATAAVVFISVGL